MQWRKAHWLEGEKGRWKLNIRGTKSKRERTRGCLCNRAGSTLRRSKIVCSSVPPHSLWFSVSSQEDCLRGRVFMIPVLLKADSTGLPCCVLFLKLHCETFLDAWVCVLTQCCYHLSIIELSWIIIQEFCVFKKEWIFNNCELLWTHSRVFEEVTDQIKDGYFGLNTIMFQAWYLVLCILWCMTIFIKALIIVKYVSVWQVTQLLSYNCMWWS